MKLNRNLVLVLASPDLEENRRRAHDPASGIDALELRVDLLDPAARRPEKLIPFIRSAARPVIVTCRPADEGGGFTGPDRERWALLRAALDGGAAYVDLEWSRWRSDDFRPAEWPADRVILSHHSAGPVTHALEDELLSMLHVPGVALKLVARADDFAGSMRLVEMTRSVVRGGRRASCFATGAAARACRLLACVEGAWMTYVAPDGGPSPVPEILTADEALGTYRLDTLGDSVKLLGILGWPLGHSLSPRMQNSVIHALGERYFYVPLESPDAAGVLEFARRHDLRGLSVTRPHKESVLPLLDALDETARSTGAVNTIVRDGHRMIGWNTDFVAAQAIVREWALGPDDRALVLGAGGAARAVVAALRERGVPCRIFNRDVGRGRRLADDTGSVYAGGIGAAAREPGTVLVNATPVGAGGETMPIPAGLAAGGCVLDLAYRPGGTPLVAAARAAGHPAIDGLDFLARQGAAQFALWTRRLVSPELFREALTATPAC